MQQPPVDHSILWKKYRCASYHAAPMPDWKRYHAAIVAGSSMAEIANACETAWSWLDLTREARRARTTENIRSDNSARWMLQALNFVRLRLLRDAGIAADDAARFGALDEAVRAGRATTDEMALVGRYTAAIEIGDAAAALFPSARAPLTSDPDAEALVAHVTSLTAAIHGCDVGWATPLSLDALRAAIDTFDVAGRDWKGPAQRDHAWWLSRAWCAVARSALELGRNDEGRAALERAAASSARADDINSVEECEQRLRDLALQRVADFDSAAERELRALLVAQHSLGRVQALLRLARETSATGDKFEATRLAETAAQALSDSGYADPETDVDGAIEQWIATASHDCSGTALVARLCQVAEHWAAILGTRFSERINGNPQGAARAEACLREIGARANDFYEQAGHAEQSAAERFAVWYPEAQPPDVRHSVDDSKHKTERGAALLDALYALRSGCNDAATEVQVEQAADLLRQAEALGSRFHIACAHLEYAYVLIALKRFAEVPAHTLAAMRTLLGDNEARLSAFTTGFERELYLTAIVYQARALGGQREFEALLTLCEPVIRDIESERARVNSPYQQSTFLATRAEIYELAAVGAYRTKRWDVLLATTELLKARAALRSRLVPALDADANGIEAAFRQANEALASATRGSAEERELRERRRWLVTARAIARAHGVAVTLPELTVHALQQALEPDEAAISWFGLASEAVIVMAITREGMEVTVVQFDEDQLAQQRVYLDCLNALAGPDPDVDALLPPMHQAIASFGEVLLPVDVRKIISGKARLMLCPHRSLHLFPFHAAPWRQGVSSGHLIEHFAVRYVPNLSSLLVPWSGNRTGPVLALGVAHFDDSAIPALPDVEVEVAAVAAAHGVEGRALTGVTRAQFKKLQLHEYRCLHLATHASSVLAGSAIDDPLESCLYLRDGVLSGWEITTLALRAELVVLAACHSGQRAIGGRGMEQLPGDDLFGFSAMLFESGVLALLGTLWPVDDETARAILIDFHRAYAGGAVPEVALQSAIRTHLASSDRRREVFDWAPFFISSMGRARTASEHDQQDAEAQP